MQDAMDPILDGMVEAMDQRQKQAWIDFWRWGFSDLCDDTMRGVLADVMAKVLLDWGPGTMTDNELEVFRISSLVAANVRPTVESSRAFDA